MTSTRHPRDGLISQITSVRQRFDGNEANGYCDKPSSGVLPTTSMKSPPTAAASLPAPNPTASQTSCVASATAETSDLPGSGEQAISSSILKCTSTTLQASSSRPKSREGSTLPGPAEDALSLLWQELEDNPPAFGSANMNPNSFPPGGLLPSETTITDVASLGDVSEESASITTPNGTHVPQQLRATSVSANPLDQKKPFRVRDEELAPIRNRKRAASLPPSPEKPRPHPFTQTPRSCTTFAETQFAVTSGPSSQPALSAGFDSTHAQISRGSTHPDCKPGKPCRHPLHWTPPPNDSNVIIYKSTLYFGRRTTVDEAEYILSRCDCYWASKFSVMWSRWCQMTGDEALQSLTKAEWLLSGFHNQLMLAAGNCCPSGQPVVIVLDD